MQILVVVGCWLSKIFGDRRTGCEVIRHLLNHLGATACHFPLSKNLTMIGELAITKEDNIRGK